ncbi:MAG: hypothetical protein Q7S02_06065 [bacterium]|nr:hypothetical protein [bacterium]
MGHPQHATIDLLHAFVDRLPPRFPRELGRYMAVRLGELERDTSVSREALDRVVAEFGKYTWHERRAWEEVYERAGKADEEQRFLTALPGALRERVLDHAKGFSPATAGGGEREGVARGAGRSPCDVVRLPAFERYTPEDRLIIEEALLRARRDAADRLGARLLAGELPDYDAVALRWKQERLRIEEQLLQLRTIAREKPALGAEITKVVTDYEIGFSGLMGREPTLMELRGVVADYANRS